jgi:hypothetical protein
VAPVRRDERPSLIQVYRAPLLTDEKLWHSLASMDLLSTNWWLSSGWAAFWLFLLPAGPGATVGILVAKNGGLGASTIAALYVLCDVLRAFYFQPLLAIASRVGSRYKWSEALATQVTNLANRARLGNGLLGQVSSLTLLSMGAGFTVGALALPSARLNRTLGWSSVILGDATWFLFKLAAALGLATVLPDDRLVFLGVAAVALLTATAARRLRAMLAGARPAPALSNSDLT